MKIFFLNIHGNSMDGEFESAASIEEGLNCFKKTRAKQLARQGGTVELNYLFQKDQGKTDSAARGDG